MTNTWIIGCGDTGKRVSHLLQLQGKDVNATSHSTDSSKILVSLGINVFAANLDEPESLSNLPVNNSDIFYFAPPPRSGEQDKRMGNFLDSLDHPRNHSTSSFPENKQTVRRIVYISTTGVYGDQDGNWITEETPTAPGNARSKRRLSAEEQLKAYCITHKTEYMILRVAGIYDLNKLPINKINAGLKVLEMKTAPASNRIHAADLANICIAAMQSKLHNKIFNVADGNPSSISDYFIQTSRIFNLTPPLEISWEQAQNDLSPEMLSYLTESKKIDVKFMQKELRVTLSFPTLAKGLYACKKEYDKQNLK